MTNEKKLDFIRVADPNKDILANLLVTAKGPGRTMKKFAAECGSSQPTFSRIANQSYKGPLSNEMIKAIAEHADPGSGVSLDMLMGANGMARVMDSSTVVRDSRMEVEKEFINSVLSGFEMDGRLIANEKDHSFLIGTTYKFKPDLLVRVKSAENRSYLWAFELILPKMNLFGRQGIDNGSSFKQSVREYGRLFIEKVGRILPLFYNSDEPIEKFSFVVTDEKAFEYLVSEYAEYYCVPFNVSFIFYSIEREAIEMETALKRAE